MEQFPFPDKFTAREELPRDVVYGRIPSEKRNSVCDDAWETGVRTAEELFAQYPGMGIYSLFQVHGLEIVREDVDKVSAGFRFFSEYDPKKNQVFIYVRSVGLFADKNGLTEQRAEELILAHEFYHFLEENKIGKTSERYILPILSLGPIKIGSTGVRSLCEIGAYGFAKTYWDRFLAG